MDLFFAENIKDKTAFFSAEETAHFSKSMRLSVGDKIYFTDGKGFFYKGKIQSVSRKESIIEIVEKEKIAKPEFELILAVAPTKNIARFEWILEKCTEMGISAFMPFISENSERKILNAQRLEKIIVSACKQSLKAYKPELRPLTTFDEVINMPFEGEKYIAHCYESKNKKSLTEVFEKSERNLILIGPEGDFSQEEINAAEKKGFKSVSLGKARLRTETAAIAACHSFHLLNEMKK